MCSGYNAFWKQAFEKLNITNDAFQMEQQLLARARKNGLRISEVTHYSDGRFGGISKTSGIKQGFIDWFVIVLERFYG